MGVRINCVPWQSKYSLAVTLYLEVFAAYPGISIERQGSADVIQLVLEPLLGTENIKVMKPQQ